MSKIEDGGPAFPVPFDSLTKTAEPVVLGMSLRDWFAGQALAGILAGGFADTVPHDDAGSDATFFAYSYADAMLAARKAPTP